MEIRPVPGPHRRWILLPTLLGMGNILSDLGSPGFAQSLDLPSRLHSPSRIPGPVLDRRTHVADTGHLDACLLPGLL